MRLLPIATAVVLVALIASESQAGRFGFFRRGVCSSGSCGSYGVVQKGGPVQKAGPVQKGGPVQKATPYQSEPVYQKAVEVGLFGRRIARQRLIVREAWQR